MARQVKETPVLEGKDAKRFNEEIKKNKNRKVPAADYQRALASFHRIKIAKA